MGEYTVFQGESSDNKRGFGRLRQLNILSKNREKRENGCLFGRRSSMGSRNHPGGELGGKVESGTMLRTGLRCPGENFSVSAVDATFF